MRGPWELYEFCNMEAEAILEVVAGITDMEGDLGE